MFISQNHSKLSSVFRLTTPAWETARFALDKRLTHECAIAAGVSYPRTYYPRSAHEVRQIDCPFPLILKPTIRLGNDRFSRAKAWLVNNRTQLVSRYREAATLVDSDVISVQEFIPGTGTNQYSYAALWHQGRAIASLTARRKRQYPIDCGTGTCVEIVDEPRVEAAASHFLQGLSYDGLVEIEFKYDTREEQFKLLDVNARVWGWIGLGSAAGIDFPLINWQWANGERSLRSLTSASATWFHASRDFFAICGEMTRGNFMFGPMALWRRRCVFAAFAADDPLPGFADLPLTLWRMLRRRRLGNRSPTEVGTDTKLRSSVISGSSLAERRSAS
jgi:predicted ATP-grasp superfamily ATP-dependent carboligase